GQARAGADGQGVAFGVMAEYAAHAFQRDQCIVGRHHGAERVAAAEAAYRALTVAQQRLDGGHVARVVHGQRLRGLVAGPVLPLLACLREQAARQQGGAGGGGGGQGKEGASMHGGRPVWIKWYDSTNY